MSTALQYAELINENKYIPSFTVKIIPYINSYLNIDIKAK